MVRLLVWLHSYFVLIFCYTKNNYKTMKQLNHKTMKQIKTAGRQPVLRLRCR